MPHQDKLHRQRDSSDPEALVPKHGAYRKLKSFQIGQPVYAATVRFCNRYIEKRSRMHDRMVQAARSGVQNIAEGSQASGTSKKTELKLTKVARASLEELRLDYGRFFTAAGAADMGAESTLNIPLTYNGVLERNMPMGQITSKLEKRLEDCNQKKVVSIPQVLDGKRIAAMA